MVYDFDWCSVLPRHPNTSTLKSLCQMCICLVTSFSECTCKHASTHVKYGAMIQYDTFHPSTQTFTDIVLHTHNHVSHILYTWTAVPLLHVYIDACMHTCFHVHVHTHIISISISVCIHNRSERKRERRTYGFAYVHACISCTHACTSCAHTHLPIHRYIHLSIHR